MSCSPSDLILIANLAAELVTTGLRNDGERLVVVEKPGKTDPHYRLCCALQDAGLIPMSGSRARAAFQMASGQ